MDSFEHIWNISLKGSVAFLNLFNTCRTGLLQISNQFLSYLELCEDVAKDLVDISSMT